MAAELIGGSMLDQIRWYLINIAAKKYAPIATMAALAALGTFMAAHAGLLEQYGITYGDWPFSWPTGQDPSGPCLLIEMDTLSKAAMTAIVGLIAVIARATEHHTIGTTAIAGGRRATDPPAPPTPPVPAIPKAA
jgi:hypothetical protein